MLSSKSLLVVVESLAVVVERVHLSSEDDWVLVWYGGGRAKSLVLMERRYPSSEDDWV